MHLEAQPSLAPWKPYLEVPWVVISRVIGRVAVVMTYIRGLITPFITTHEPPSKPYTLKYVQAKAVGNRHKSKHNHTSYPEPKALDNATPSPTPPEVVTSPKPSKRSKIVITMTRDEHESKLCLRILRGVRRVFHEAHHWIGPGEERNLHLSVFRRVSVQGLGFWGSEFRV